MQGHDDSGSVACKSEMVSVLAMDLGYRGCRLLECADQAMRDYQSVNWVVAVIDRLLALTQPFDDRLNRKYPKLVA